MHQATESVELRLDPAQHILELFIVQWDMPDRTHRLDLMRVLQPIDFGLPALVAQAVCRNLARIRASALADHDVALNALQAEMITRHGS
jgi:hypothetical protein